MDPSELLQVSMVEDDNPMEIPADNEIPVENLGAENGYPSITVSAEELNYYETLFSDIDSVKYKKLHCTACNIHMGTSPASQVNRYEHPLLKVLICRQCYNFYSSGDFEKDADGSELYCRWCGQGGQVYCCAKCPFVFCKRCIRRNIGQSMVTHIESSDDWLCYACDPKSIWMLRGLNWALQKYSASKMSIPSHERMWQDHKDILTDYSMCCKERLPGPTKSKNSSSSKKGSSNHNEVLAKPILVPKLERLKIQTLDKQMVSNVIQNNSKALSDSTKQGNNKVRKPVAKNYPTKNTDEVVCTPDIIAIEDDSPPASPNYKMPKLEPKPKPKSFLQVKPASKLIDPIKNDAKTYKTIQYSTSLVSTPVNLQTLQNNPVVSGMIQNLQKHLRPGEPQKIIKIVSPDGRAFLIDPMKVPTSDANATATMIAQTVNSAPPPLHVIKQHVPSAVIRIPTQSVQNAQPMEKTQIWFENSINGLQKISQLISSMVINLVNDNKSLCNWVTLYNNFQTHLKMLTDNVESLKLQVRNEYLQTVQLDNSNKNKAGSNADFGQHFLSFADENAAEQCLMSPNVPQGVAIPPSVLLLNTTQPPSVIPIQNPLRLETVNSSTNILKTMLDKTENGEDMPDDVMLDPKDLLEQKLEEGDGTIDQKVTSKSDTPAGGTVKAGEESGDEEVNEAKIEKLKKHLLEMQKEIAKRKTENVSKRESEKTDEIFDMDVTCDSDDNKSDEESDHSLFSINSESDSDCMVVAEGGTKKRKVRQKKSPTTKTDSDIKNESSDVTVVASNPKESDSEVNNLCNKRKLENDHTSQEEVVAKKLKQDENITEESEKVDANSENKSENVTEGNTQSEEKQDKVTADNADSETNTSLEKTEKENEESENNSSEVNDEKNSNKSEPNNDFNQTDLVSIANAIRESIIESRNLAKPKKVKPKVGDLEKLLSSNVVFKKSDTESNETQTGKSTEKAAAGNSYGDAFSNFLATATDDNADDEIFDEQIESNDENVNSHENSESVKNKLDKNNSMDEMSKLESDVLELQRITENIIANVTHEH